LSIIFGSSDPIETIQIIDCESVELHYIQGVTEHLKTVIVLNTERLEVHPKALPDGNQVVFFGNIAELTVQAGALESNVQELYLVNTNIKSLHEPSFEGLTDLQVLDLKGVNFPEYVSKRQTREPLRQRRQVFPKLKSLSVLRMTDCQLGQVYDTFLQATVQTAVLTNNAMVLKEKEAFKLEANETVVERNNITDSRPEAFSLTVYTSLTFRENIVDNSDSVRLIFPNHTIDYVEISDMSLRRVQQNYINCITRHLNISGCTLHLTQERVIDATAENFEFRNNIVTSIETEALIVRSGTEICVRDNLFHHIQPGALANLTFDNHNHDNHSRQHTFKFANNSFESMENGFLRLDPSLVHNNGTVFMDHIYLIKECDCDLVEMGVELPFRTVKSLEKDTKSTASYPAYLVDLLKKSIQCKLGDEVVYLEESGACRTDSPTMVLVIAFGVTFLVSLLALVGVGYCLNEKLKRRALKKFIVPVSSSREGEMTLQRVESIYDSLPDLVQSVEREAFDGEDNGSAIIHYHK